MENLPIFEIIATKIGSSRKGEKGEFFGRVVGRIIDAAAQSLAYSIAEEMIENNSAELINKNDSNNKRLQKIGFTAQ